MDFEEFLKHLGASVPLIEPITDMLTSAAKKKDDARKLLAKAIDDTAEYYSEFGRTFTINREKMKQLVDQWRSAAIALRSVNPELAEVCDKKAEYWIDPMQYSPDSRTRIQLQLDYLRERYKEI